MEEHYIHTLAKDRIENNTPAYVIARRNENERRIGSRSVTITRKS